MSDEHPVEEPGTAAPTWAAVPTMPWSRVPDQRRSEPDNVPTSPPVDGRPPQPPAPPQQPGRTYGTRSGRAAYAQPETYARSDNRPRRDSYGRPDDYADYGEDEYYPPDEYGPPRGYTRPPEPGPPPAYPRPAPYAQPGQHAPPPAAYAPPPVPSDPYARPPQRPDYERPGPPPRRSGSVYGGGYAEPRDEDTDEFPRLTPSAPVSSAPVSSAPVSSAPVSSAPVSSAPVSPSAVSQPPVSSPPMGPPVSSPPVSPPPYSSAPVARAGVDGLQATGYLPIVRPGAAGFPPELAAVAATVRQPETSRQPETVRQPEPPAGPDPEQVLASYEWRFDPDTLREQVEGDEIEELQEIRDLLTEKLNGVADNPTRARLLSLRAVVSRILGDLLKAFADAKLALAHAEATGELRRVAIAQARLAHVMQWRGEYEEADRLFALANSSELPDRLRATMHQHAGRCAYDQGRYMEACNHFERALDLRKEEDPELIAQTELALDAVFRRVAEKGWGPYPRTREEILQIRKPPAPAFDETTQRWGFIDANFDFCIGPGYVDVQPFRDGVAWVQRQGAETWELVDDTGRTLIDPSSGYLGVSSFSDGLAWVSRDGTTWWIAIDKANTILISTGFDDVRPFRRGVAAVRKGRHWGAVDGVGRVVVPFQFDGFATALHDGRYIDGFSDEGLAIVSLSGRKGVVDRSGRVIVAPVHHVLMIHPVAFLVADEAQRWGALDRRGRMIIDQTFSSRMGVTDEIDRLLADTRPVM